MVASLRIEQSEGNLKAMEHPGFHPICRVLQCFQTDSEAADLPFGPEIGHQGQDVIVDHAGTVELIQIDKIGGQATKAPLEGSPEMIR
jgi:hypothetical protein